MRDSHAAFAVACLAASGFLCTAETNLAPGTSQESVREVVRVLEQCPAWSNPKSDPASILRHLAPLSAHETPVLRLGIQVFVRECRSQNTYGVDNMSKLFVLNRVLFAVSDGDEADAPFFGGWEGVPHDEKHVNSLWPLAVDETGRLRIVGKFKGYSGPLFLAVQEFDHFLEKFGRRPMEKKGDTTRDSTNGSAFRKRSPKPKHNRSPGVSGRFLGSER